jgi:nicotinamide mononucleotide transporter
MLLLEILAVIFGVLYIILAAQQNRLCWIFGVLGSAISIYIFVIHAKLYSEALLYLYYVFAGIYGWIFWTKSDQKFISYKLNLKNHLFIIIVGLLFSFLLNLLIVRFFVDAQRPMIDSITTVFSFIATFLTARKFIDNWLYWIVIDFISVFLYMDRGLYIYSILMLLYTILAFYGYKQWKQQEDARTAN